MQTNIKLPGGRSLNKEGKLRITIFILMILSGFCKCFDEFWQFRIQIMSFQDSKNIFSEAFISVS